jgi:hypothetical protein
MLQRRTLPLSPTQRAELEHLRDHDSRPYVRERSAALLKIADGRAPHAVAREGLLRSRDPDTIYQWLDRYQAEGVAGIVGYPHGGNRRSWP